MKPPRYVKMEGVAVQKFIDLDVSVKDCTWCPFLKCSAITDRQTNIMIRTKFECSHQDFAAEYEYPQIPDVYEFPDFCPLEKAK